MKKALRALFFACAIKENTLICMTDHEQIFEKIDIKTGEVHYINSPKGYIQEKWTGTDAVLWKEEEIYFVEQSGEHIMKYSLYDEECQYISLNCKDNVCNNFAGITIYKNNMYLFPRYRDNVLRLDLNDGIIKEKGRLCPEVNYRFNKKEEMPHMLYSCSYRIRSHVWIFMEKGRIVIDYDLELEEFEKHVLPKNIKSCELVEYKEKVFYILTMEGQLFSWSLDEGIEQEIYDFGKEKKYPYFGSMVMANSKLWLLPYLGKDIYIVDIVSGNNEIYQKYPMDFYYYAPQNWAKYLSYCCNDKYIYFAMHSGNYILSIDKNSGQERWIKPIEMEWERKRIFYLNNNTKNLSYEKVYFDIWDLVKILKQGNKRTRKYYDIGKSIWNGFGEK